jgi:hypothetical protein
MASGVPIVEASRVLILNVYSPKCTLLIISRVLGRARSIESTSNSLPGLADITKTRSDKNTAS